MISKQDLDLVQDARRGNLNSFNELVLMYQDTAYDIAYRMLSDDHTAGTATQNAFLTAYRHLSTYRAGSFRAWLLRILIRVCHNELRCHKSHSFTSIIKRYFAGNEKFRLPDNISNPCKSIETMPGRPELDIDIQYL